MCLKILFAWHLGIVTFNFNIPSLIQFEND